MTETTEPIRRVRRGLKPREPEDNGFGEDFFRDILPRQWRKEAGWAGGPPAPVERQSWSRLTDTNSCYRALRDIATKPTGNSPGVDGIRPYDLSPRLCGQAAKLLSERLRDGSYHPAKLRRVQIEKKGGSGKRDLDIANVVDRAADHLIANRVREVVANTFLSLPQSEKDCIISDLGLFHDGPQTLADVVAELGGGGLTTSVYAVREAGTREMLADLGVGLERGLHFVGNHDIRNAYPSMPIEPCLEALEQIGIYEHPWFRDEPDTARKVARAILTNGGRLKRGLPQGLTLSEVALDVRLHFDHDLPAREVLDEGLVQRFRDNLVHGARSLELGVNARDVVAERLHVLGAELKDGEPGHGIFDMRKGHAIPVLGFQVSLEHEAGQARAVYRLPKQWQDELGDHLAECYECCDPAGAARSLVRSWISWAAPALRNEAEVVAVLNRLLAKYGFLELSGEQFRKDVEHVTSRWQTFFTSRAFLHGCEDTFLSDSSP